LGLSRVEGKTHLVDYVHSFFPLLNVGWSGSARLARLVFWPPPTAMLGYGAFMKVIETRLEKQCDVRALRRNQTRVSFEL